MEIKMKRINRKLMYKGSILDVYKDTMQLADGKTEEWCGSRSSGSSGWQDPYGSPVSQRTRPGNT